MRGWGLRGGLPSSGQAPTVHLLFYIGIWYSPFSNMWPFRWRHVWRQVTGSMLLPSVPTAVFLPASSDLELSLELWASRHSFNISITTRAAVHLIVVIYRGVDKKSWLIKNWTELFVLIRFLCVFLYLKNWINNIIKIIKLVGLVFGLKKKLKNRTEYQINRITIRQIPKV